MKILKWLLGIILLVVLIYFLGPKAEPLQLDTSALAVNRDLRSLEDSINRAEAALPTVKSDNQARIIWADSAYQKTPYSMVYLHGFSASQGEGAPLHQDLAKRYGCNLFLARLAEHGLQEDEALLNLTAEDLVASAKQSIAIGKELGEKVILLTTSTGGTLGLYLSQNDPQIAAIVLYSPNIDLFDPTSHLVTKPWGLQVARAVMGSNYNELKLDSVQSNYWTTRYRLEAIIELRQLLDETMIPATFTNITQPVFMGYYYESDAAMDSTVSVSAMLEMYDQLGTPGDKKVKVAFPNVRDHVIGCQLTSKDLGSVRTETIQFLEQVVGLQPVGEKTALEGSAQVF
ncbi:MAG: alpha/beta hydrolase [Cytophagales bacterium]|nr:alpha/beta hydrolase [Cytophagales bacterium]